MPQKRLSLLPAAALLLLSFPACADDAAAGARRTVSASELGTSVAIIGALGFELGTVVSIQGRVVDSGRLDPDTVLDVISVNGAALGAPIALPFEIIAGSALPRGLPRGRLLSVRAYETGGMTGVPEQALKDVLPVQTPGWEFRTSLVILRAQ